MVRRGLLLVVTLVATACGTGTPQSTPAAQPTAAAPQGVAAATSAPTLAPTSVAAPTQAPTVTPSAAPTPTTNPVTRSTTPTTGPRITNAVIASEIRDAKPVQTDQFYEGATEFFIYVTMADATPSTSVHVKWVPVKAPDYKGNNLIQSSDFSNDLNGNWWQLVYLQDSLPPGQYAVDLSVNNAVPQRVPFTVLPAAPPILASPGGALPGLPSPTLAAARPANVEFILDASGSMNEPVGDTAKMDAAHQALHEVIDALPGAPGLNVGLRTFSSRSANASQSSACQDTQLLVPLNGVDKAQLDNQIDAIQAVGSYTPLALAVQEAAGDFPTSGNAQNVVVLVTDGKENCQSDPASLIKAAAAPIGLIVDVIGFNVADDAEAQAQLKDIAAATGGQYVDAESAADLDKALQQLTAQRTRVVQAGNEPGQLTLGLIPGTTYSRLRISGNQGTVVDDRDIKGDYQLPAGSYTVNLQPDDGQGTIFRVQIGSGQESKLPLGALAITARSGINELGVVDEDADRRVVDTRSVPDQPFMLPTGRYAIMVKPSSNSDWLTVQRDLKIEPETIAQVGV